MEWIKKKKVSHQKMTHLFSYRNEVVFYLLQAYLLQAKYKPSLTTMRSW